MDLNDDCLREIFRRILGVSDIFALSRVCKRFLPISKEVFANQFRVLDLTNKAQMGKSNHEKYDLKELTELFECFGEYITELAFCETDYSYEPHKYSEPIFELIQTKTKCLRTLKLMDIHFGDTAWENKNLNGIFRQLATLHLQHCHFPWSYNVAVGSLFENCWCMESFTLLKSPNCIKFIEKCEFPRLTGFHTDCDYERYRYEINTFFKKNPNIKYLTMDNVTFHIFIRLPKLESLRTVFSELPEPQGIMLLRQMNNLKELSLTSGKGFGKVDPVDREFGGATILRAVAVKNKVEALELWGFDSDEHYQSFSDDSSISNNDDDDMDGGGESKVFKAILKCDNLKSLRIGPKFSLCDRTLSILSKYLPNLTKMYISWNSRITSAGLTHFIDSCANLVELIIMGFFRIIGTKAGVEGIARIIKNRRREPLTIVVDEESFEITNEYNTLSIRKYIRFLKREQPSFNIPDNYSDNSYDQHTSEDE